MLDLRYASNGLRIYKYKAIQNDIKHIQNISQNDV